MTGADVGAWKHERKIGNLSFRMKKSLLRSFGIENHVKRARKLQFLTLKLSVLAKIQNKSKQKFITHAFKNKPKTKQRC
jgi:hypothetical protein